MTYVIAVKVIYIAAYSDANSVQYNSTKVNALLMWNWRLDLAHCASDHFLTEATELFSYIYAVGVGKCLTSHLVSKMLSKNKKTSLPLLKPKSLVCH